MSGQISGLNKSGGLWLYSDVKVHPLYAEFSVDSTC